MSEQFLCPICERIDMVRKVSIVYEEGNAKLSPPQRESAKMKQVPLRINRQDFIIMVAMVVVAVLIGFSLQLDFGTLADFGPNYIDANSRLWPEQQAFRGKSSHKKNSDVPKSSSENK